MLIILDGFGEGKPTPTNAVHMAKTPFIDQLRKDYSNTLIEPGGVHVGVLEKMFGSSGVGHNTIGTGTCVRQAIKVIDDALKSGEFFENSALIGAIKHAKKNDSNLHLFGIGADSMLHAYKPFIFGLLDICNQQDFPGDRVFLHLATDGRDNPPNQGIEDFAHIERVCQEKGVGKIASIVGRIFYDRGQDWPRTEALYDLFTDPTHETITDHQAFLREEYKNQTWDQMHQPKAIADENGILPRMKSGDAIINFAIRADRGRQPTEAIANPDFDGFERKHKLENIYFTGLIPYDHAYDKFAHYGFEEDICTICLSEVVDKAEYRHLHIAGKEKFIFVTYNFNRCANLNLPGETFVQADQTKDVDTFDLNPEMSAPNVTKTLLEELEKGEQDLYFINYENPDQVGHTGDLQAAIEACEAVELGLSQVVPKALEKGFEVLITADHGNADEMVDDQGRPHVAHTFNPVPFIFVSDTRKPQLRSDGDLADIAPTIIDMLDLEVPEEMTGSSLIDKSD